MGSENLSLLIRKHQWIAYRKAIVSNRMRYGLRHSIETVSQGMMDGMIVIIGVFTAVDSATSDIKEDDA